MVRSFPCVCAPAAAHGCTRLTPNAQTAVAAHGVVWRDVGWRWTPQAHGKIPAIAEFGVKQGCGTTLDADWWTRCFLDPLAKDPVAAKVAYAMTWGNSTCQPLSPTP